MGYNLVGAGLAAIAMSGAGIGIGNVFASLMSSFVRSPKYKDQLFAYALMGFALVEAIALMAFVLAIMLMSK